METFTEFWKAQDREQREKDVAAMTARDVSDALNKEVLSPRDFLTLLSLPRLRTSRPWPAAPTSLRPAISAAP